ncbi:FadR family transcriptional regulator [Marivita sp. S6314]|uniref:FadR/GntR family transcriptional regulator n=1 Tax=Marivita sp. S6314 TaxID=2926406 RepID=UPI001FF6F317|nr:FadR/GntR family transcriptional regulator [Marivita sp. S6314]MCK0151783.1 FadR family transcriptional regulator [Marivita sp. S6314]
MPDSVKNLFGPVGHESVADTIIHHIEELIVSGVLKDGTRLPSERALAEEMKVSRPKVREALKRLEDDGLIIVRHGEGNFVAPLIGSAMSPALVNLYARHVTAFEDYLEFRREQESFAAMLAAERATTEDREALADLVNQLEAAHEAEDADASRDADVRFHATIVDASHNSLMVHTMAAIYQLMARNVFYNRDFLRAIDGTGDMLLQQHKDIANAIIAGQSEKASDAAADHIDFVARSFRVGRAQDRRETVSRRRKALLDMRT